VAEARQPVEHQIDEAGVMRPLVRSRAVSGTTVRGVKSGLVAAACAAALLTAAGPAAAQGETVTVQGTAAPNTPPELNKVFVTKFGPSNADRVLVLVPGTIGGAGNFTLIAQDIIARVPNLQVWAVDRRSQAFEDTSMFAQVVAGQATVQQALDYYLGWILDPSIQPHFQPLDPATVPFVRDWGLEVALEDLRNVVREAGRGRREVLLGGHSLGASTAVAYATWGFGRRPGYRDIEGLVLIDGGLLGTFDVIDDPAQAQEQLDTLAERPFADLLEVGIPPATGIFAEVGGLAARLSPTEQSIGQNFPLLPQEFNPGFPVTNRGLLGYALDDQTSPASLSLIHVNAGQLAPSGDPRDWQDGEVTPIARLAATLGQEPVNGVEWYFPRRLTIDVDGADKLKRNKVTKLLGLRTFHLADVDLPVYAVETSLAGGDVLEGARHFIKKSSSRRKDAKLVDASATMAHLDPLTAAPETNEFLETVVPFLKRLK
jgi:pimeloyl-ACP methyl ester carboxylesterase